MSYDAIIIGGGHNGLTAAALLQKRGSRVLVLEQRDALGGLASGEEFHPGHHATGVLHDTSLVRHEVIEALALEQHGLARRATRGAVFVPEREGPGLLLHADPTRARSELSMGDAERYVAFRGFLDEVRDYVRKLVDEPPPDIVPRKFGEYWSLLKKGVGLRRLGRETMYECLRVGPMALVDWLGEYFESELVKAALAAPALIGTYTGPRAAGTAALLMMHECAASPEVEGGPAALIAALARAGTALGVEYRTGARVRRIRLDGGRVVGVELEGGDPIDAPLVLSSVDPRQTFFSLLAPSDLPTALETPIRNWRCRGTTAKLDLALDGPLEFAGRPGEEFESICVGEGLIEIERAFDGVKYGELPAAPHLDIAVPTVMDPGLAPDGHHVVSILVHFVPHDLRSGWDDAARTDLLKVALERLSTVAPTCRDRIVGHRLRTPVELEHDFGVTGGHVHHGEHGLDQMFSLRPTARCARYATPIPGLHLCGSGSHPGGGITCAPGWLAAGSVG